MDSIEELSKLLAELKAERALIEEAIAVFQKMVLPRGSAPARTKEAEVWRDPTKGTKNKPARPRLKR